MLGLNLTEGTVLTIWLIGIACAAGTRREPGDTARYPLTVMAALFAPVIGSVYAVVRFFQVRARHRQQRGLGRAKDTELSRE